MTQPTLQHNLPEYSVSEIAGALKRTVEDTFGFVRVRGEISAWKVHSSGHAYFRLKDEKAVLDAVCWKGTLGKVGCKPEEGLEIIASGRITTYPGKSSYQIIVERIEPAGTGALMQLLERRKALLTAEGLFALARKRPLPFMPRCIGVITSPTGAVIRDILHRIRERFPCHVMLWPVAVQGEGAAEQVAAAIRGFNALPAEAATPRPDVLIVARGGGSLEDLWAFNEEIVVRATASSGIPLISAVGHETDTTLIDYAADKRAPTPTAAAEMATPVREELLLYAQQMEHRMNTAAFRALSQQQERLQGLVRGLPRPAQLIENATQRLDGWSERLNTALPALMEKRTQQLEVFKVKLRPALLNQEIKQWEKRLVELSARLAPPMLRLVERKSERLQNLSALLSSLSYEGTLKRGFALVKDAQGKLITSAAAARAQDKLHLTFKDGEAAVYGQKE